MMEQLRYLVIQLTDIKPTLTDGTPSTLFKVTPEFKGKFPMDVIGACSPLDIATSGKLVCLLLLANKVRDEVMWSVTPLSIIN